MNTILIKNKIEQIMSQEVGYDVEGKRHTVPRKLVAIVSGLLALGLIMEGATSIEKSTYISLLRIAYGFFILLPVSYYQMKAEPAPESKDGK